MTEDAPQAGYFKRQFYILSNLGLFYIIIIAMFAIPLLGSFVIILIKGVMDLRYVIMAGFAVLGIGIVVLLVRLLRRLIATFKQDGALMYARLEPHLRDGQTVQLGLFRGLLTFSYGGRREEIPPALPDSPQASTRLLPDSVPPVRPHYNVPTGADADDCLQRLQVLSGMRTANLLTAEEYSRLKQRLLNTLDQKAENVPDNTDR